jgi:hypothetical protein
LVILVASVRLVASMVLETSDPLAVFSFLVFPATAVAELSVTFASNPFIAFKTRVKVWVVEAATSLRSITTCARVGWPIVSKFHSTDRTAAIMTAERDDNDVNSRLCDA